MLSMILQIGGVGNLIAGITVASISIDEINEDTKKGKLAF
jgi:hypothetical protein